MRVILDKRCSYGRWGKGENVNDVAGVTGVEEVAKPADRRWLYGSGVLLALVVIIAAGVALLPVVTVVPGSATANQAGVTAAAADRRAAEEAAAAKKAADDAAEALADAELTTKSGMQKYISDPDNGLTYFGQITVFDVVLIQVGPNRYEGEAECALGDGPHKQVAVHVLADGMHVQWSTDRGGMAVLLPGN